MGGLDLFPNAKFYIQKREIDKWVWALTLGPEFRFLVGAADPADIIKATPLAREGRMIAVDGDLEDVLPGIDLHLAADTHTYASMYVTVRNDGARARARTPSSSQAISSTPTITSPGSIRMILSLCRSAWRRGASRTFCLRAQTC
jgi:hypothetical protein